METIGFDLISDLNLQSNDNFDWEVKVTSLYCLIAGNISDDLQVVSNTLRHLNELYQGVFYVPGLAEYKTSIGYNDRTNDLMIISKAYSNVTLLYHNVAIIDGVAVLGTNCWSVDRKENINEELTQARLEDIAYLNKAVSRLQTHGDVKKIILMTACVPNKQLYFGKVPDHIDNYIYPDYCLSSDTEMKISHWAFGSSNINSCAVHEGITYISNPYKGGQLYWPHRISISV